MVKRERGKGKKTVIFKTLHKKVKIEIELYLKSVQLQETQKDK